MKRCGYRYFRCDNCETEWKEKTRDAESPSGSPCPNEKCNAQYYGLEWPVEFTKHPEWQTDQSGNLVEPNTYIGPENIRFKI